MKVLVATPSLRGHVNPKKRMVRELVRAGAEVGWFTLNAGDFASELSQLGARVLGIATEPSRSPRPTARARAELLAHPDRYTAALREALVEAVPRQIEPIGALIDEFQPDVAIVDTIMYGCVIALHQRGVRYASVSPTLAYVEPELDTPMNRIIDALRPSRAALFERYGLEPRFCAHEYVSPYANTVFATQEFIGAAPPPGTALIGPALADTDGEPSVFPWHRVTGDPLVYVTFGSLEYWQPQLIEILVRAARGLGVQVVLNVGELASSCPELGNNVIAIERLAQVDLDRMYEAASAIVCHGGANTVMESLYHGVPMIVYPIHQCQPIQAHLVERAGVGIARTPAAETVAGATEALSRILFEPGFRDRGAPIMRSYRSSNGSRDAWQLSVELIRTGAAPIPRVPELATRPVSTDVATLRAELWSRLEPHRSRYRQDVARSAVPTIRESLATDGGTRRCRTFFGESMSVRGGEIVSELLARYSFFELELTHALIGLLAPGMTFLDVGAHLGYFSLLAARIVGDDGRVEAFEPSPATFSMLRKNTAHCRSVNCLPLAIWERSGALAFRDYGDKLSAFNSFADPRLVGPLRDEACRGQVERQVNAVSLDEHCAARALRPDVIKIDAESAELAVLRGADTVLREFRPVVSVEVGDLDIDGVASSRTLVHHLAERGYLPFEIDPASGSLVAHRPRDRYDYANLIFLPRETRAA